MGLIPALVLFISLSMLGTLVTLPRVETKLLLAQPRSAAMVERPSIVLFLADDFADRPRRLWGDADRTPELARFLNHGLEFTNAVASTPLCAPSRANLLTGRYGHDNQVTQNDIAGYRPRQSIAQTLGDHGYRTAFVGKHMNRLATRYPTRSSMSRLARNWDRFNVIWENQGKFYGWRQYNKSGIRYHGYASRDHSSRQAAELAARHIGGTPKDQPLFMVVSLVDGHKPMTPLRRFEGHRRCRDIKPWSGGSYNERRVGDKPRYVRRTPLRTAGGYPLGERCEQSMTIDWVVKRVREALERTGRYDDTLQILTADNAWLMGAHRLEGKGSPYSAQVPLYLHWPAAAGRERRVIKEPVSNVDYASPICELAGCRVPNSDGLSLLPLILGSTDRLDRRFVYTEYLHPNRWYGRRATGRPAWAGVESTLGYSETRWAYTRYSSGEEELYDLTQDPHRLRNLAGKERHADVLRDMRRFVRQVWERDGVRWREQISFR
jgi:N-acetylglucosamine-6-sulfatase